MTAEKKYKFSIIMSIYNVEKYLKEAIDSIITQTIGFEENVELILVNDGSKDNSEDICLEYKNKYPNNIIYVKKENGGLSSAKNAGLQHRRGKYINFFDSDDILEKNVLEEVYKFFEKNYNTISMVAIPLYFFEAKTGIHPKYDYMGEKNRIINLDEEPYNFVLSSASAFYKTEIFDELKNDERMVGEEDTKLNCQIYEKDRCFGYVCEKGVKYNYRKRNEGGSIVDQSTFRIETYYAVIYLLDDILKGKNKDNIPNYLKELILYETRSRLKHLNQETHNQEYNNIIQKYRYYLSLVDEEHIIHNTKWITNREAQYYYLSNFMETPEIYSVTHNGFVRYKDINLFSLSDLKILVQNITCEPKNINFEITFWKYNMPNIEIIAQNDKGKIYNLNLDCQEETPFNQKFGIHTICKAETYTLKIPYEKQKIEFYVVNKEDGKAYKINNIKMSKYCSLALRNKKIKMLYKNFNIAFNKTEFIIKKHKGSGLKYNLETYMHINKKYKYNAIFRIINRRKKNYILINDRPEKASDNGEAIFKHINKNDKDMAKNTYFVISKKSEDYKRLKKIGKVVRKGSLKHKFLFLNSKTIMSSHMGINFYSPFPEDEIKYYRDLLKYKFIWLQHGITQNDISAAANKHKKGIDYIVIATQAEYNEFKKEKYAYKDQDIIFSGFARYDYLDNDEKNIITIAPTWREYLSGKILESGYHDTKSGFEQSEYYNKYKSLLNNEKLNKLLKEKGFKIKFLLHPGMVGYANLFKQCDNDCIEVVDVEKIDYSTIFSESKLLITDYSSVFFDFAYLRKPVIYYQFDKEEFFSKHYKQGYFDYEEDGLGSVIYTEQEIIDKIEFYFENNFKTEEKHLERINATFKYNDKNNCKRLLEHINH